MKKSIEETLAAAERFHRAGDFARAEQGYRQALGVDPSRAATWYHLGSARQALGRPVEAEAAYQRAVRLAPGFAEAHQALGLLAVGRGDLAGARECLRRAVAARPDYVAAHNNLGNVLKELGEDDAAIVCFQNAVRLKPDYALAQINLGNLLRESGRLDEAEACCRRAVSLDPTLAAGHYNLGMVLSNRFRFDESIACYRQALRLSPSYAEAENNLGFTIIRQGLLDEAVAAYRRALAIRNDFALAASNLVFAEHYQPGVTLPELVRHHVEWAERYATPLRSAWRSFPNSRDPERRLRLGFISPDLGRHPVGFFIVRCLEALDRRACEVVCYSDRLGKDDLTDRIAAASSTWRDVRSLGDEALTARVRDDRIDILFDLAGHTAGNRQLVFARKPAPIQVEWAGYPGGTALPACDYLVADWFHVPEVLAGQYREKVIRMPDGYVCYDPPGHAPAVGPLPALGRGHVTFGSFNFPAKVTPEVVALWADVLRRVPGSRLVLKYQAWGEDSTRARYASLFAAHGVDPARLDLLDSSPHAELLGHYNQIDLALDPFPYSGGLTTCEALWMGVPVVTCPGETFSSRHSLSHLSNVGLTETIARDLPEYVALATGLALDLPRLSALRAGLRDRVARSPLCDGPRFADHLLTALRSAWREWCAGSTVGAP